MGLVGELGLVGLMGPGGFVGGWAGGLGERFRVLDSELGISSHVRGSRLGVQRLGLLVPGPRPSWPTVAPPSLDRGSRGLSKLQAKSPTRAGVRCDALAFTPAHPPPSPSPRRTRALARAQGATA
eukprot:365563-Chlamydomonas_euryale.AAC.1